MTNGFTFGAASPSSYTLVFFSSSHYERHLRVFLKSLRSFNTSFGNKHLEFGKEKASELEKHLCPRYKYLRYKYLLCLSSSRKFVKTILHTNMLIKGQISATARAVAAALHATRVKHRYGLGDLAGVRKKWKQVQSSLDSMLDTELESRQSLYTP